MVRRLDVERRDAPAVTRCVFAPYYPRKFSAKIRLIKYDSVNKKHPLYILEANIFTRDATELSDIAALITAQKTRLPVIVDYALNLCIMSIYY